MAGVDPGLNGAICVIAGNGELEVYDMPTLGDGKRTIDPHGLAGIFGIGIAHAFIEQVASMPRDGHVGAFKFGTTFGHTIQAAASAGVAYTLVTPVKWKRAMGLTASKTDAVARASQLMPDHARRWMVARGYCTKAQAEGRAEAALIAFYGLQELRNNGVEHAA
jgi:hypothetical protein